MGNSVASEQSHSLLVLVANLVDAGVSKRQAEKIKAALGSLPFRNAKNPAGYLVR